MRLCLHCGARVAMRPDGVWVHASTRTRFCARGPIPRPAAQPAGAGPAQGSADDAPPGLAA